MEYEEKEICADALVTFGKDSQTTMLVEELGELLNAIAKCKRGRASVAEVITELADVSIMVNQMALLFGYTAFIAEKQRKLERLKQRIKEIEQYELRTES